MQNLKESFLRNFNPAAPLLAFFSLFLLVKPLALARDVAAVTLGCYILSESADILPGNDRASDNSLQRYLELVLRNSFPQFGYDYLAAGLGAVFMNQERESVYLLAVYENIHFFYL